LRVFCNGYDKTCGKVAFIFITPSTKHKQNSLPEVRLTSHDVLMHCEGYGEKIAGRMILATDFVPQEVA
jgi:hypothetical protein